MYEQFLTVKITIVMGIFTYLSLLDVKSREVDPKYWLFIIPLLTLLSMTEITLFNKYALILPYILGIAINTAIGVLFYYFGLFGGADMFSLIALTIALPLRSRLTLIEQLLIPLYASIMGLMISLLFLIHNIIHKNWLKLPRSIDAKGRILLFILGIPVTIGKYIRGMRFFYPLIIHTCSEYKSKCSISIRYSFAIDEEYQDYVKKYRDYLNKGLLTDEDIVWVTYGIPFIINFTVAYILVVFHVDLGVFRLLGIT